MKAYLPNFFLFKPAIDLIRLGRDNDGGYLVCQSDIVNSDLLISFGIADDWSFEKDFKLKKDIEIYAYDASVNEKVFLKRFIKSLVKFYNPFLAIQSFNTLLDYLRFFSEHKIHHIKKFVGLNSNNNIDFHCTLSKILDDIQYENIFLKIDVEGSEYRFLETLISNQSRISGLVIEMHDCDVHLKKIENFIMNFQLNLVHIHANNHGEVRLEDGLPLCLELTFSKYCKLGEKPILPNTLDMPNNKDNAEINLIIEN